MYFKGSHITYSKNKPKSRSQASCLIYDNLMLIFGGLNSQGLEDLWICNLSDNYCWVQIHPKGNSIPDGRFGHSAVIYKRDVYFYGGITGEGGAPSEDMLVYSICKRIFN